jgi:polycystin 1L2
VVDDDTLSNPNFPDLPWHPQLGLYETERQILAQDRWLNGRIIDAALQMLDRAAGVASTTRQSVLTQDDQGYKRFTDPAFQIVHTGEKNHWVTLTSIDRPQCGIRVFDSKPTIIPKVPHDHWARQLFGDPPDGAPLVVISAPFQTQNGDSDCGLFAIAAAVTLSRGENPSDKRYNQASMRQHLTSCFQNNKLEPFPEM